MVIRLLVVLFVWILFSGLSGLNGGQLFLFGQSGKRPLKFAGTWYDDEPSRLAGQLRDYEKLAWQQACAKGKNTGVGLIAASKENTAVKPAILAVVAPHAGYSYSGKTAAFSYLSVGNQQVKRVFLLGPSHYKGFHGAALSYDKSFQTVLGEIECDTEVVDELKENILFQEMTRAHHQEHSLELQLAFIKAKFPKATIVPIMIGTLNDAFEARFIARELASQMEDGDLVVVSSDFTHYGPRFEYEPFKTEGDESKFLSRLKALDMEALSYLERVDLEGFMSFHKRTDDTICGVYALSVLLALLPEDCRGILLNYRTSLEATKEMGDSVDLDHDFNTVSYMSIAFESKRGGWNAVRESLLEPKPLTAEERESLLKIARITLEQFVREGRVPELAALEKAGVVISERMKLPHGAFVTLHKTEAGERDLRGCIGYIFPVKPLYLTVIENTVSAAAKDPRFKPVTAGELDSLDVEVSVLTPPHKVPAYTDIKIGRDGVLLKCRGKQSVFLPSVAVESGWTLEETLEQLALKAGLPKDAWKDGKFEVFRSESMQEGQVGQTHQVDQ